MPDGLGVRYLHIGINAQEFTKAMTVKNLVLGIII
jgi:hypothetical protein